MRFLPCIGVLALSLMSCQVGPRLSDLGPTLEQATIKTGDTVQVNTSLPVQIMSAITVDFTQTLTSRLDVCILPGNITLTVDVRDVCLGQAALPEGVAVDLDTTIVGARTLTFYKGSTTPIAHQTAFSFSKIGTYTIFPRHRLQNQYGAFAGHRISPGTVITVK
ncbi:hypothetical protein GCM10017783_26170 [Deinococcus piscis]|uniref:Lipoprotein n=1 Tax=Deinococcus piscis TaxID=394230 RepID=A0ABQ3KCZ0_9DEIO|nr:hypothetical protein GCM10017783_26170 [Deinococcus piscis]